MEAPWRLETASAEPLKSTLSRIKVPPDSGTLSALKEVTIPLGVFLILLSRIMTEPTVWLKPPLDMFRATPQSLTERDLKVHAQFQFMKMAVLQLLKVRLRVVNCWLPKKAP